ncbi:MMPL family transporter, partial [candidate division KSB1 bacterium]|nr:MMPL family transporter [candidate division KSB1 bacterium]NIR71559.1 MMPL family transporter [candidate division KSB1 bacterium]NIS26355.1 MMPL family transporter [candidate division KSB1 bacterium]NIT73122.1 MMPL family transporter [candidate division KSB1 bacterium]NIU27038.1 MMPL family transporter [candidate division KSB1 bacterium]
MIDLREKHHLVYTHYIPILIAALVLSAVGGYFAAKLPLESDLAELLPDRFQSVQTLNRIRDEIGGVGHLRVILDTQNFEAAKKFAEDLEQRLLQSPIVNYVDYKNDVAFYKKNALLFLEMSELDSLHATVQNKIDEEKQQLNPLLVDDLFGDQTDESADADLAAWEEKYQDKEPKNYYTNEDSTILIMKVFPSEDNSSLSFVQKMFDEVKSIVQATNPKEYAADMNILYGGNFKNRLDEYKVVKDDILGTAIYGFSGVFLLIVLYFRRLSGAILITLTLLCALAWTFGVTYFVIGNLNTITGFMFVILFGLGIDYGIHAFARYAECRRSGMSFESSIEKVVCQTGKALTTTAITTSAAFFSLMLMDFKGFSDLGFIAGIGMLFALIAMVVVLPAFLTLFHKLGLLNFQRQADKSQVFQRRDFRFSRAILVATFLVTGYAFYSVFQVEFEYDFTNLRAITEEREVVSKKTKGVFELSESPAVVLADSRAEVQEVVEAARKIARQDTSSPTIDAVRSVFSLVPKNQPERLAKIREIRQLIKEEAEGVVTGKDKERLDQLMQYLQVDEPFTWEEFPQKDKRQFINKEGEIGNFVFIYPSVPLRHGKNAIEFREDIGKITTGSGKTYYASSSNIILAEMLIIMIQEGRLAVILTFLVVFLIVMTDLRSVKAALFVLTPLALGVLWMVGIMHVV